MKPAPIYTADNTGVAYQLNWSYSIFWHQAPDNFAWFEPLRQATESDGIRLLNHQFNPPNVSQFLVSTKPQVAPKLIAQRVKGRLQYLLQPTLRDAFRRNYCLRSIGSTKREKLEAYIASQLGHHPMDDERVQARFEKYQIYDAAVDLSSVRETAHARYWHNLHTVFVMRDRARHLEHETLTALQTMIYAAAAKKGHLLSRAGILPDHVHLTLGCSIEESPEQVALSYMNNLAFAARLSLFNYGYWVGTFGDYDLGVVPRPD